MYVPGRQVSLCASGMLPACCCALFTTNDSSSHFPCLAPPSSSTYRSYALIKLAAVSELSVDAEQLFTCKLGGRKPTHSVKSPTHSRHLFRQNGLIDYLSLFYGRWGKLILWKIIKIAATRSYRCHILKLKCTKFDFGWGSAPQTPLGELTALPQIP